MEQLVVTAKQLTAIKKAVLDGISISSGAKSSATYYHKRDEQVAAVKKAIAELYATSKELPLILANQNGATGTFIQEALYNEFKETSNGGACRIVNPIDWVDNGIADKALLGALWNLDTNAGGIPYVLRLFMTLKKNRVRNERLSKIALGYIVGHPNLEFVALKYRNKIKEILTHMYGERMRGIIISIISKYVRNGVFSSDKERQILNKYVTRYSGAVPAEKIYKLLLFIYSESNASMFPKTEFPIVSQYYTALTDILAVTNVPEEVLIGLVSEKKHPQYSQLWASKLMRESTLAQIRKKTVVTSVNQQVRQTKKNESLGVKKEVNLEAATDFLALYKTGFENGFNQELLDAIDKLAAKKKLKDFSYQNIGIILDESASMKGHSVESKNTPRAIGAFTAKVLDKSAKRTQMVYTTGENTDLASAFVELLKKEDSKKPYDAVFIITDGYENQYDGLTGEVISTYLTETARELPIYQVSPITGAEMGATARPIAKSNVAVMAITNPASISTQINANLLEVDTKQWLANQVRSLEESSFTRVRKNHINA